MPKQTQGGDQTAGRTPGEWHVGKYELQSTKAIYATDGWPVAEAVSRNNRPDDEVLANARLIAACPTMALYVITRAKEGDKDAQKIARSIGWEAAG